MAPQLLEHALPERLQRIEGSGLPPLAMVAWNDCNAPSSTEAETGERETAMSLVTVTLAVEDLEESAWLVAVTWTFPPGRRSAGAVKSPSGEMVPNCGEPPTTPLTLQKTEVSEVLVTVAERATVLPSNTVPELGVMLTAICGGGGVVEPLPPPPPPQAARKRAIARKKIVCAVERWAIGLRLKGPCFERVCERGRMTFAIADEGPANERGVVETVAERLSRSCFL